MKTQKTLGIIGGMSWESMQTYYQLINQGVKEAGVRLLFGITS